MSNAAQRRAVGNAYTEAGLLVGRDLTALVVDAIAAHPDDRDRAIAALLEDLDDLDRRLATKLVDLAREALTPEA